MRHGSHTDMVPASFAEFSERMMRGGTLDDDIAAGRVQWDITPARPRWWVRLSNWVLEVFSDA
jgi:hypothetical protein